MTMPKRSEPRVRVARRFGSRLIDHAPAVQRQDREQVEHASTTFHAMPASATVNQNGRSTTSAEPREHLGHEPPDERLHEVASRARRRDPEHVALGMAQVAEVHGHGLRPAEDEPPPITSEDEREDDGADRVDVPAGLSVTRPSMYAVLSPKQPRDVAVRRLVQRDREHHRERDRRR